MSAKESAEKDTAGPTIDFDPLKDFVRGQFLKELEEVIPYSKSSSLKVKSCLLWIQNWVLSSG